MEERQQELRNELDEQYGQNMMAIKESMSQQYEDSMKNLKKDLADAKQQVLPPHPPAVTCQSLLVRHGSPVRERVCLIYRCRNGSSGARTPRFSFSSSCSSNWWR